MEQFNVQEDRKVAVDFSDPALPRAAKTFRPLLFMEGETFCCVLGPDLHSGVVGRGETIDQAIAEWDKNLQDRIRHHSEEDELARYISETLRASVKKIN